jgi:ABC-type cobalamin/Fe3+-siderophores transport system ATPase subunit
MITKITFTKKQVKKSTTRGRRNAYDYIADVPAVNGKTFKFKPGLNILVGQNGAGKSTVLKACALSLAAHQGGYSVVTQSWVQDLFGFSGDSIQYPWEVTHDGQPVYFIDPRIATGLAHGAFDEDFFAAGVANTVARGSTGEKTLSRINQAISVIIGKESMPAKIVWKMDKRSVNDTWGKRLEQVEKYLAGSLPVGQQTIIMDEPESYLGIPIQVGFWKRVIGEDPKRFDNLQVIIATHSPFAFGIPHAYYIELKSGYIKECEEALTFAMEEKA